MAPRPPTTNPIDAPIAFVSPVPSPMQETMQMIQAEAESIGPERAQVREQITELESGEWFGWYIASNEFPCGPPKTCCTAFPAGEQR